MKSSKDIKMTLLTQKTYSSLAVLQASVESASCFSCFLLRSINSFSERFDWSRADCRAVTLAFSSANWTSKSRTCGEGPGGRSGPSAPGLVPKISYNLFPHEKSAYCMFAYSYFFKQLLFIWKINTYWKLHTALFAYYIHKKWWMGI